MKFKLAAVTLFASVAMMCSQSNGQLLDRMLGRGGCGCEAAPSCCDTPAPSCGGGGLCDKLKGGLSGGLFGGCGGGDCGSNAPILTCNGSTGFDRGPLAGLRSGILGTGPTIDTCGPTCGMLESVGDCGCGGSGANGGCKLFSGGLLERLMGAGGGSCGCDAPAPAAAPCGCGSGGGQLFQGGALRDRISGACGAGPGGCGGGCGAPAPAPVAEPCGCAAGPAPCDGGGGCQLFSGGGLLDRLKGAGGG